MTFDDLNEKPEDNDDITVNGQDDENDNIEASTDDEEIYTSTDEGDDILNEESDKDAQQKPQDKNSTISADLIRGHINTIILRALYERDKYGYEIINDIESKSHSQYTLKQPTLYSALKRLETQGYIKAYWKTDEVSAGGRRKYFTLTDAGRQITEKNLAEWEYSRTIIDSLISDRDFDFNRPAPTPVDFTLLRNSVSRVPNIKSDEVGRITHSLKDSTQVEKTTTTQFDVQWRAEGAISAEQKQEQPQNTTQPSEKEAIEAEAQKAALIAAKQAAREAEAQKAAQIAAEQAAKEAEVQKAAQIAAEQAAKEAEAQKAAQIAAEQAAKDEARKKLHENYLKLISEPVRKSEPAPKEDIVPNSENVDTGKLIYGNKPETERDYKNLVNGIYNKALSNGNEQTTYYQRREPAPPTYQRQQPMQESESGKLVNKGKADGVFIAAAEGSKAKYATKTTYNKGLTLFKCSSVILAIIIVEFIFCSVFLNGLNTTWIYPFTILGLGIVQFTVCGIIALAGYGRNCVRPTTNGYIGTCAILNTIIILIITALAFLMNINPTEVSEVFKMIIIPSLTACNLTVFSVMFYLFVK